MQLECCFIYVVLELVQRLFHDANAGRAFTVVFFSHPTVPDDSVQSTQSPSPSTHTHIHTNTCDITRFIHADYQYKTLFCEWTFSGTSTLCVCASSEWTVLI